MKQTINTNVFPKSGYVFTDSDGTKHTGGSWPGVIARVREYRQRAGLPLGDVTAEVIAQACMLNPGLCHTEGREYTEQLRKTTLKSRILQWMAVMRERATKDPIQIVPDAEKQARAVVCSTCPWNTQLPTGCSSCTKALIELRKGVIGLRPQDGRLNACDKLGEDLPTSVYLDLVRVSNNELPANCWRKTTV